MSDFTDYLLNIKRASRDVPPLADTGVFVYHERGWRYFPLTKTNIRQPERLTIEVAYRAQAFIGAAWTLCLACLTYLVFNPVVVVPVVFMCGSIFHLFVARLTENNK